MGATLFAAGLAQAEPPAVEKPATMRPQQAKPVQKPQATSDRDKVGATGYHDKDQDEPTQERPNPLDYKPAQKPQATSDRAKAGATGYVPESDEETQERPNPMSGQSVRRSAPMQAPDNMQQQTPVR